MPAEPQDPTRPGGGRIEVLEGGTRFLLPLSSAARSSHRGPARRSPVFYNAAMALSRDLHVAVVDALARRAGRRLSAWDMLAASGVRGLRALNETGALERLLATELQPVALEYLTLNVRAVDPNRGTARAADAHDVPPEAPFDLVDLDPYGTPMPFLETAIASLGPGGVLAATATDMAVLAGPERETCERRYGGRPLRNYLCREAGLRILIAAVARLALLHGRRIHPLLSYARDHHVRTYLRMDPARGEEPLPIGAVPFEGYRGPPLLHGLKGGPLWTGPLHDRSFVHGLEPPRTPARPSEFEGWLSLLREEVEMDTLFYYESGEVGRRLALSRQPPLHSVLEGLREKGHRAVRTAMEPSGWRTDATWEEVSDVVLDPEARRTVPPSSSPSLPARTKARDVPAGRPPPPAPRSTVP